MSTSPRERYVCLLNGSLHGAKASSPHFLKSVERQLSAAGIATRSLEVQPGAARVYSAESLRVAHGAEAVVLACPLYGYSLPGGLMRLLEDWARWADQHPLRAGVRFYGMVNCGFVVPETIDEALRVLQHFCRRLGLEYRFSLAIASGLVAVLTEPVDLRLKRAYRAIVDDMRVESHTPKPDLYFEPLVPRIVMDTIREYLDGRVQRNVRKAAARAAHQRARTEGKPL